MNNNELISNFFKEAYDFKNYNFLIDNFSSNYIDYSLADAKSNKEAIEILKIVHNAFPDIKTDIIDLIEENNKVVIRLFFKGTHMNRYMNIEPTYKKLNRKLLKYLELNMIK